jgi:hypothetical protein
LNVNYKKDEIEKFKTDFFKKNNRVPEVSIALAVTFTETAEEISAYEAKIENRNEAFTIIAVTIDSLYDLLMSYQDLYGIDEFIIYDTEKDGETKLENIRKISAKFKL